MHSLDKTIVARHFSNSAHHYDDVTPIQSSMAIELAKSSITYLHTTEIKSVIEIGCGTGNLTQHLVKLFPHASLTAIDISQSMINLAKKKLSHSNNINFINADAEIIINERDALPNSNLIISNAAVQWFSEPQTTILKYSNLLNPGGLLSFATFGPQTFHELNQSFICAESKLQLTHIPRVLNFCSEQNWIDLFSGSKEFEILTSNELRKQTYSSVREFLFTIKKAGATNAHQNGSRYISKNLIKCMERIYKQKYSSIEKKGIYATYHILLGFINRKIRAKP